MSCGLREAKEGRTDGLVEHDAIEHDRTAQIIYDEKWEVSRRLLQEIGEDFRIARFHKCVVTRRVEVGNEVWAVRCRFNLHPLTKITDSIASSVGLRELYSLQRLIFPYRNISVFTCSCQEILCPTHIHPKNPIRMPLQHQLANIGFNVPYSYTFVKGTGHNPLVIREQRKRSNRALRCESFSVNIAR